ncbi:Modification methylase HgiDII [Micropruina glycogenica]|uniref:DNA (cytosine-5-)-methyltransferase n=1 Tax=Micropruina glycogenica TaxID=75385 RepID=A0A2N9JCY4_9ACTN|nr:Modification methylase HgiDII [Micropruina glycogenica]
MTESTVRVSVIDLFSGAGGLSLGLRQAGMSIAAGIDVEEACRYPYEANIEAPFLAADVRDITGEMLTRTWAPGHVRLLAGCAPCQPFSAYRRGADTSGEASWPLLDEFGRLVRESRPELVTMENVPRIGSSDVFSRFVSALRTLGYCVAFGVCHGPAYGLPQQRRRLVLSASLLGEVSTPSPPNPRAEAVSVRHAIAGLPSLAAGESDPNDRLHKARVLSATNLQRIQASSPGGTWEEWPEELRAPCHRKSTGASFRNVYARMTWDDPSPTITTMAFNFGTGRFGHPEQDRAISLREAAILQGFPREYAFVEPGKPVHFSTVGRMIGNAVPPPIAKAAGQHLLHHVRKATEAA